MRIIRLSLALVAAVTLSACLDTDLERGLVGATGGALAADAMGGSVSRGVLIGATAGVLCDDLNVPGCR
ncbi:MAG: hypothetical protein HLUCCA08_11630 [Rhodobacteraceae bacterium HLUCCA08]|nr:MAG: hypothetical protein HLUCCA08_11630 [Rhodobacteraceae bacterium HLUCCA08]